jgi:hypothetical protein
LASLRLHLRLHGSVRKLNHLPRGHVLLFEYLPHRVVLL